ncbi:MAG: 2-oxoacid:acceptor oxidoreductase family protein [Thermaerobacterales bacterium]
MRDRSEIRVAGFGGQGVILAGHLTGKAAAIYDGLEACVSQAYGPEARGGACHADVVISGGEILYPVVTSPDILMIMSQEAFDRYGRGERKSGAVVILEEDLVTAEGDFYRVPATRIAEDLGTRLGANTAMLGAMVAITGALSRQAVESSIRNTVKPRFVEYNLKVFDRGFEFGRSLINRREQPAERHRGEVK